MTGLRDFATQTELKEWLKKRELPLPPTDKLLKADLVSVYAKEY